MSSLPVVFYFGESDAEHITGDADCESCWTSPATPHDCGMSGCLEHTSFGDESYDGYWLHYMGDLCRHN